MLQKLVGTVLDAGGLAAKKKKERANDFVSFQLQYKKKKEKDTPRSW